MALLSSTSVIIDGNTLRTYNTFSLKQDIGEHHDLELFCYAHNLEKSLGTVSFDDVLGTVITIEIKPLISLSYHNELRFKGVITGIVQKQGMYSGEGDVIVIQAKSPTILAEDGPHFTSYNDKSFVDIITQNFRDYDASKIKINTSNSKLQEPILYTVQNNESCFEFAKNLAARHGEWLYYNGIELMFGLDTSAEAVGLKLGRDLKEFSTTMVPAAQKFNYLTNDYLTDEVQQKDTASINENTAEGLSNINSKSEELYAKETQIWLNLIDDSGAKNRLDSVTKVQKEASQANQLTVNGVSDNPGVNLGNEIVVNSVKYRVVHVAHHYSLNGEYHNVFKAISSQSQAYPKTNIMLFPVAQSQTAIVKDNNDPEGLSRIQVQFRWQEKEGVTTPWIRMLSPHGGGEKGFHFIPEIGEEVLVGFEGGNAECPYFMGSLYNSKAKASEWKTGTNDIKAIRTRSGHTIQLDDKDGEESITISDKNTNIIHFNTKEKTLTISSEEKLFLRSKFIALYGDDIQLHSKSTKIVSETESVVQTGGEGGASFAVLTKVITSEAQTVEINGTTEANIVGAKITTNSTGETLISGALVKLNS